MLHCAHCGSPIRNRCRTRFCSAACEDEHRRDLVPSVQRINSFQALEDVAGAWRKIDNASLYFLSLESRRVSVVERISDGKTCFYRILPAGRRLLKHWKAVMEVSA